MIPLTFPDFGKSNSDQYVQLKWCIKVYFVGYSFCQAEDSEVQYSQQHIPTLRVTTANTLGLIQTGLRPLLAPNIARHLPTILIHKAHSANNTTAQTHP